MSGATTRGRITAYLALLVAVLAGVQTFLAMAAFKGAGAYALDVHRVLGTITLIVGVGVVGAALREFRNERGIIGHASSIPLFLAAMAGLARADGWLAGIHGFLAVAVAVAASSLATIALRRPGG